MKTCSTCKWWEQDDGQYAKLVLDGTGKRSVEQGWCHRFPPTVISFSGGGWGFRHPITEPDNWCGEHEDCEVKP